MSRFLSWALLAVALAATLAAGYWAGSERYAPAFLQRFRAAEHDEPAAATRVPDARKVLYYRNPMGLPDTSPVPKKDPMGMDYIPVYEGDEPDDAGVVRVNPARVQALGVKTALAEERTLDAVIRAVGRVEVNERAIHDVAPRFEGWIERLFVNATGDPVRKGQPLFSVYSPELVSAQKELRIAEELKLDAPGADPAAREGARRLSEAARERLQNWDITTTGAEDVSHRLTFSSPANGIVLEKQAVEGMRFTPGTPIYRIADLSTVWVIADIYEQDLARVSLGQTASVAIDAFPDRTYEAKVTYLYPTVNAPTRTTPVRLEIANRHGLLRPGMFAHVELAMGGPMPRLVVPKSAVIDTGSRQAVLIALGDGRYKPAPVRVGIRGRDDVEILEGLAAGDRVVVSANFLIDAESNLKAALSSFSAPDDGTAAAGATAETYEAAGTIESVDAAAGTVSIAHAPIPDLKWPAMTMEFTLASPDLAAGAAPGQRIRFSFEDRGGGEFLVTRIATEHADAGHAGH